MLSCQRHLFSLPEGLHYLNCGYMSPLSRRVEEAGIAGIRRKRVPSDIGPSDFLQDLQRVRLLFATLVNVPDPVDTANAKAFIDAGATAVIGHHPHVPQGIELYKEGLISYSLGSFIYVHEKELGYSQRNISRHISVCLNIEFDKQGIREYQDHYYRYNPDTRLPESIGRDMIMDHIQFLNNNIHNKKLLKHQVRKILFRREIASFRQRFRSHPVQTIVDYAKRFKFKYIRKAF